MKKILLVLICIIAVFYVAFASNEIVKEKLKTQDTTIVTATIYKPSCGTTTADGFRINKKHAGSHKLIAISWDLRKDYPFGTRVYIMNAGKLSGVYHVKDLMNKRWHKKIDILVDQNHPLCKFENVKMVRILDSNKNLL